MRVLKHHEKKLLKKVDFFSWKEDQNIRESSIIRKYHLQDREDYIRYNKIVGMITKLTSLLTNLKQDDPLRKDISKQLLEKMHNMGLISRESTLIDAEKMTVSSFCRRRLPVVLMRVKMAESLKEAIRLIEQGHVRVGPHVVTDPAFLVTRTFEDYVTWVDSSKIKKTIMKYNDKLDDYDLLGN